MVKPSLPPARVERAAPTDTVPRSRRTSPHSIAGPGAWQREEERGKERGLVRDYRGESQNCEPIKPIRQNHVAVRIIIN